MKCGIKLRKVKKAWNCLWNNRDFPNRRFNSRFVQRNWSAFASFWITNNPLCQLRAVLTKEDCIANAAPSRAFATSVAVCPVLPDLWPLRTETWRTKDFSDHQVSCMQSLLDANDASLRLKYRQYFFVIPEISRTFSDEGKRLFSEHHSGFH